MSTKKLFAVGTRDPDPRNWKAWEEVELYIADNKKEALEMGGYHIHLDENKYYPCTEIDMSESCHLVSMPEYIDD